jgi:O-antigen/teichoic acid export membrane protein
MDTSARKFVETEATIVETDGADLEGLTAPIAPPIVTAIEEELEAANVPIQGPMNGSSNGQSPRSLKQMATHGSLWTIAGYGTSQILRFGSNLILAKLLFPQAFGSMAIINGVMQGLTMLSDVGIGQSIIRHGRRDDPEFYNTAWTLQVIRGALLTVIGFSLAWPVGQFYDPFLTQFIAVISLSALISGFNSTKIFTANRDMQLKRITLMDLTSQVVAITVMVGLARIWPSIWCLVIGALLAVTIRMVLSHVVLPGSNNRFHWCPESVRELFSFGRWIFLSTMFTFLGLQSDKLILGRLVPLDILGIYAVAFAMTATVAGIFEQLVYRVLMPAMVHVSKVSSARFAEMVLRSRRFILMGAAIAVADLIILAPAVFQFLYDDRYLAAGWMTQLLGLGLWFTLLQRTSEACLLATDRSRALAHANVANFLTTIIAAPLGFYIALSYSGPSHNMNFGIAGFIGGWTLGNFVAVAVLNWELVRHGVPVIRQDITKSLFLLGFVVCGRVMQIAFHNYMSHPLLFWFADVLPAIIITLAGAITLFLRNRQFAFAKSGAV